MLFSTFMQREMNHRDYLSNTLGILMFDLVMAWHGCVEWSGPATSKADTFHFGGI